jgi:hypothetical protein
MARQFSFSFGNRKSQLATGKRAQNIGPLPISWIICAPWRAEFEEIELNFKDLGEADFRLYKSMQKWHNRISDMLAYLNDVLSPHGFDDIVKDDFAALRQMLQRRC